MPAKKKPADLLYEAIDPTLPADQWDDSEPGNIQELDRQIAQQSTKELEKVAIRHSRPYALLRVCALLVPVALSFAILQLSWRHRYWHDSVHNPVTLSEDLATLQIAAKAHEILIVLSLSDLVLYYLRQRLSSTHGLPFGLFTSAYQFALGGQPISQGFFYSVKSLLFRHGERWRPFNLALSALLLPSTLLGLAVGPSSAIVLIPRLNWWSNGGLFQLYTSPDDWNHDRSSPFTMYIPRLLFPNVVDASSLPGPYCLNANLDVNGSCPFAGYDEVLSSANFTAQADNATIDSPLSRVMATETNYNGYGTSASTWTTSHVIANYMSLALDLGSNAGNQNPSTVEASTQGKSIMTPFVDVYCDQRYASVHERNLSGLAAAFGSLLGYQGIPPPAGDINVLQIWDQNTLAKSNDTMIVFKDSLPNATSPGILAFVFTPATTRDEANVTICGINAAWEPSTMWVFSSGEKTTTVASNFTIATYLEREIDAENEAARHGSAYKRPFPINITKSWADALNPVMNTSSLPVLAQLLQDGAKKASQDDRSASSASELLPGSIQSIILSKAVADGLARIGAEYRVNPLLTSARNVTVCRKKLCSSGPYMIVDNEPKIFNGTVIDWVDYAVELSYGFLRDNEQLLHSFPEPDDVDSIWTEVSFPVKRYGYAWSFDPTTVKIATAVLMLHALVIFVHCCYLLFSGRSYAFASSLGDLVALALNSQPPEALNAASVSVGKEMSWIRPTAVRWSQGLGKGEGNSLQLVAGDGFQESHRDGSLYRRPVAGKRYR